METYFHCLSCRSVLPEDEALNLAWTGWRKVNGVTITVKVDNFCCPQCNSNNLVWNVNPETL